VHVGTCGYVLSCLALNGNASRGLGSRGTYPELENTPMHGYRRPGYVSSRGVRIRQTRLIGSEILPTRGYPDGREYWCGLVLGLVLFRLVVPPLQHGVAGPYLVWGTWFPTYLPLEGTGVHPYFLGHNQRPVVPGVQDLDSSP
jgi:hypothetical protein